MYAQMILRNKRFKPTFPLRESPNEEPMLNDEIEESEDVPEPSLKAE